MARASAGASAGNAWSRHRRLLLAAAVLSTLLAQCDAASAVAPVTARPQALPPVRGAPTPTPTPRAPRSGGWRAALEEEQRVLARVAVLRAAEEEGKAVERTAPAPSPSSSFRALAATAAALAAIAGGYVVGKSGRRGAPRSFPVGRRRPLWPARPRAHSARVSSGADSAASAGSSSSAPSPGRRARASAAGAAPRHRLRSLAAGGSAGAARHPPPPASWAAAAGAVADLVSAAGVDPAALGTSERVQLVSAVVAAWRGFGASTAASTAATLAAEANAHLSSHATAAHGMLAASRGRAAASAGAAAAASARGALADALAAGLALHLAAALWAGGRHGFFVSPDAACGPFAPPGAGWWLLSPTAAADAVAVAACRTGSAVRALAGGAIALTAARTALRAGLAGSHGGGGAPLARLAAGLGAGGAAAGALAVRGMGGDVRLWLALWGAWIVGHAAAAVWLPRAAARAAAREARKGRAPPPVADAPALIAYAVLVLVLPLLGGWAPFARRAVGEVVVAAVAAAPAAAVAATTPPPAVALPAMDNTAPNAATVVLRRATAALPAAVAAAWSATARARRRAATAADGLAARAARAAAAAARA